MSENTYLTGGNYGLADIRHNALRNAVGNRLLGDPGLVIGGTGKNDIDYDAFDFTIGGLAYAKGAGANINVLVADSYGDDPIQAGDSTCYYVMCIDSAGAMTAIKGKDDELSDLPGYPDDRAVFGIIKVVNAIAASATFDFGTTTFNNAGVTTTFTSCVMAPATAP